MIAPKNVETGLLGTLLAICAGVVAPTPTVHADTVAYLVNVTVRPGYNFPDAATALEYGRGVCELVRSGIPFPRIVRDVMAEFHSADEYHGTYLISQAVNELCPELMWRLRNSAAHYTGPAS